MNDKTLIIAPTYHMATGLARKLGFGKDEFVVSSFNAPDGLRGVSTRTVIVYDTDFARLPDEVAYLLQPILQDMRWTAMQERPFAEAYSRIFKANYWKRLWLAIKNDL